MAHLIKRRLALLHLEMFHPTCHQTSAVMQTHEAKNASHPLPSPKHQILLSPSPPDPSLTLAHANLSLLPRRHSLSRRSYAPSKTQMYPTFDRWRTTTLRTLEYANSVRHSHYADTLASFGRVNCSKYAAALSNSTFSTLEYPMASCQILARIVDLSTSKICS
ncbi:hypothetical protein OG21DRAFT_814800 [Imleria badia]|nr:hypothetical protein OG21DRAFT_814800 [Imleria badia]